VTEKRRSDDIGPILRRLIICADDFGADPAVNDAVEIAHRHGILTTASLMVAASATNDAVARARLLPDLRVGLHLDLIEGRPAAPPDTVATLVGRDGRFDPRMGRAGLRFFFRPEARRDLAREIRAQFEAFRATGLRLDHVNGHKHIQLHPTVSRLVIAIGREYGLQAMRLPAEPAAVLRQAFSTERFRSPPYAPAIAVLRRRLQRAALSVADHVFGVAWSGGMIEERVLRLLPHLPQGASELYFHPATRLRPTLPDYRGQDELAALTSEAVRRRIDELGIALVGYADLAALPG
jgi:hopanoid biosynthesis associated protein HpnK